MLRKLLLKLKLWFITTRYLETDKERIARYCKEQKEWDNFLGGA